MPLVLSLITIVVMGFALVDLVTRDGSQVKHVPKFTWILLVILLPLLGSILWFMLGREYSTHAGGLDGFIPVGRAPEAPLVPPASRDTRSTEEQLASLDREIEYCRKHAELEQRKRVGDA